MTEIDTFKAAFDPGLPWERRQGVAGHHEVLTLGVLQLTVSLQHGTGVITGVELYVGEARIYFHGPQTTPRFPTPAELAIGVRAAATALRTGATTLLETQRREALAA